jgi:serine/threonine-protein kinase RsbW
MHPDTTGPRGDRPDGDQVEITLPADPTYLALLRTASAALAARLDFTLDEIEDLRIAVDEAGALLLPHSAATGQLSCVFRLSDQSLAIDVSVSGGDGALDETSFAWTVLDALAGPIELTRTADELRLSLFKRRGERT